MQFMILLALVGYLALYVLARLWFREVWERKIRRMCMKFIKIFLMQTAFVILDSLLNYYYIVKPESSPYATYVF